MRLSTLVFSLTLTTTLAAQIGREQLVVATRLAGTPATQLIRVDLNTQQQIPIGRFPSDDLAPLAIKLDPINDDLIVALDAGSGTTRLIRLGLSGNSVRYERILSDLPHRVEELEVGTRSLLDGIYYAVSGPSGGLFAVDRNGGPPEQVVALPWASAIAYVSSATPVAISSPPQSQSGPSVASVFIQSGTVLTEPPLPVIGPRTITGFYESPAGRYFAHADGTVSHALARGPIQVQPITPTLPPGATTAIRFTPHPDYPGIALGGAADPRLKAYDPNLGTAQTWQPIGQPLPGDPVDFDIGFGTISTMFFYGEACGGGPRSNQLFMTGNGFIPRVGTSTFGAAVQNATPNTSVIFVGGDSDQIFGDALLPIALPGGCPLRVAPTFVGVHVADANGRASQPLPIPNLEDLIGTRVHGQWVQQRPSEVVTSALISVRIGL